MLIGMRLWDRTETTAACPLRGIGRWEERICGRRDRFGGVQLRRIGQTGVAENGRHLSGRGTESSRGRVSMSSKRSLHGHAADHTAALPPDSNTRWLFGRVGRGG